MKPYAAQLEVKAIQDPMVKAIELSFARDFGIENQSPSTMADRFAYLGGPENLSLKLRNEYFRNHPELQGEALSPEALRRFYNENPKVLPGGIPAEDSAIGASDVAMLGDVNRYARTEGKGKKVEFLTYERMAGIGPQGDEQRKAAIARKWNIDIATPSRKLKRTSVVVVPEALWDSMKELEGTPITRKQILQDGTFGRPTKVAPRPSTPPGQLQHKGQIGPGLTLVGIELVGFVVKQILEALARRIFKEWLEEETRKSFSQDCAPLITKDLRQLANKIKILDIVTKGGTAFANVKLLYYQWHSGLLLDGGGMENPYTYVAYFGLSNIAKEKIDPPRETLYQETNLIENNRVGSLIDCSIGPVTYSEEERTLFVAYNEDIELLTNLARGAESAAIETNSPEDLRARNAWSTRLSELNEKRDKALKDTSDPIFL